MAHANKEQTTAHHDVRHSVARAETPPNQYWKRWTSPATASTRPEPLQSIQVADAMSSKPLLSNVATVPSAPLIAAKDSSRHTPQEPQLDAPYRVLIVEDDRSQALFAQSVLNGAGIQARVETSSAVSQAIQDYQPDLILMDLHMPELDGIRLTTLIREQPGRHLLPIVFLTGDPDPEKEFELLESGADDVLTKPIRPRHLIAAVSNRIRRVRQQASQNGKDLPPNQKNPETGLPRRDFLLQELSGLISTKSAGHFLILEIAGALTLREHCGFTTFDRLMDRVGLRLATLCQPYPLSRLSDRSYLILGKDLTRDETIALAQRLRQQLLAHPLFINDDESVRLRCCLGFARFDGDFDDATVAIHCVERATLRARITSDGLQEFTAPQPTDHTKHRAMLEGRLELAYQPIIAVNGPQVPQYQVLLRLHQLDGSLLPASQVIPAAESAGRIVDFDQQVMDHAIGLLDLYQHATPPLRLFISQSVRTLMCQDVINWLTQSLVQRKTRHNALVIDIRLDDALNHMTALQRVGIALSPLGVNFCLSQFDNMEKIHQLRATLPLRFVRLSGQFHQIHTDHEQKVALQRLLTSAHQHQLQVIAQRLDDPQAASAMWASGVDFIQGNLMHSISKELDFDPHRPTT